ncbi:MAG: ATP-binding protein, partial [Saprospiraceae bacterium]|nr:ATP-binding protein [Saprospiraceae bacterium]
MNSNLQSVLDILQQSHTLSDEVKSAIEKAVKAADKELEITSFKLDRTEKVKRTTAILLEETIQELEEKRKAVEEANGALKHSLEELRATQAQLIHSEKMASLGELTAGIAHEIKNPLNFVNNFSEVSQELLQDMHDELKQGQYDEALEIAQDVIGNLEKITHHGRRADQIVRGMLQHSRGGTGEKEPTDLNALADEYLRLAYHGLRAKDKSFNAEFVTDLDPDLPEIQVVPQDIGRVLLNLINNAFYAVSQKRTSAGEEFRPTVRVTSGKQDGYVVVTVQDNGLGIPPEAVKKIFQPFFTTKPAGEGTGLGLSLAYDIVTKGHAG